MFPPDPATTPALATTRLRLLVTAKAAPRPTDWQDETVHAVGLSIDPHRPGWVRLYPVSPQDLTEEEGRFETYDLISVDAEPARDDPRRESWRPLMRTLTRERHLKQWQRRRGWLDPYTEVSMCRLDRDARDGGGRSLALVRPSDIDGLLLTPHPGWTPRQRRRLWAYLNRADHGGTKDPCVMEPPRLCGTYRYRCHDRECLGHEQSIGDWEFVALQRRLTGLSDDRLRRALATTFLDRMCGSDRDFAFYVGRGPGTDREFRVLGGYWPPKL